MLLWVALVVLTVSVAYIVLRPLLALGHGATTGADRTAGGVAVYQDQLAEIDRDLKSGVINETDASAAKIEVSRRLLTHAEQAAAPAQSPTIMSSTMRWVTLASALALPLIALPLYLKNGAPSLPSQVNIARVPDKASTLTAEQTAIVDLVAKVEARLRARPDDGMGWDVIAPVYMKQERFEDARAAFRRAIQLLGETPKRLTGMAEASIRASGGRIPDDARIAFEKVLKAEPQRLEARFWLALRREQDGDLLGAAAEYAALLAVAPVDAAWQPAVKERLAVVNAQRGGTGDAAAIPNGAPGPTTEAVAAAEQMSPADRERMIQGMVDGLHARLKQDGRDPSGWQRLLRAYVVMGQKGKASAALEEARQALADNKTALGELDLAAREMGLGS